MIHSERDLAGKVAQSLSSPGDPEFPAATDRVEEVLDKGWREDPSHLDVPCSVAIGECVPSGGRSLRVLVADDSTATADSLSTLVKMWGHDAWATYDGAAALDMTSTYRPDVLLVDIAMPKMDGCLLAQQLRRQARFIDTLLIAMTAYSDDAQLLRCEEAGFDLFLIKPVEPSTLEELLLLERDRLLELCRRIFGVARLA